MRGGVGVELQHAANVIRQQRDLDPAALSAQRECHDRLAQIGRRGRRSREARRTRMSLAARPEKRKNSR
jgi:hypothetical protein